MRGRETLGSRGKTIGSGVQGEEFVVRGVGREIGVGWDDLGYAVPTVVAQLSPSHPEALPPSRSRPLSHCGNPLSSPSRRGFSPLPSTSLGGICLFIIHFVFMPSFFFLLLRCVRSFFFCRVSCSDSTPSLSYSLRQKRSHLRMIKHSAFPVDYKYSNERRNNFALVPARRQYKMNAQYVSLPLIIY